MKSGSAHVKINHALTLLCTDFSNTHTTSKSIDFTIIFHIIIHSYVPLNSCTMYHFFYFTVFLTFASFVVISPGSSLLNYIIVML